LQPERTALITGASSGFGLLTAVTLAKRGWRVMATMRDLNRRDRLLGAARDAGVLDRIELHALDVTNPDQIASLAAEYDARHSPLDALVNNAGIAVAGSPSKSLTPNCAFSSTPTSSALPPSQALFCRKCCASAQVTS